MSAHSSLKNLSQVKDSDSNSNYQFSPDFDERSSLSSFKSRSLNGTEFSKSSLGIVNVDQVSDFCTEFLTDFDQDDSSIASFGHRSRKSDIENHLRECLERESLGSNENGPNIDQLSPRNSILSENLSVSRSNEGNYLPTNSDGDKKNPHMLKDAFDLSSNNEVEDFFKKSFNNINEMDAFFKHPVDENDEMENYFKGLNAEANERPERLNSNDSFDHLSSSSLQSFGFDNGEFGKHNSGSIMQELERDEQFAKIDGNSITDQAIDGSMSGIMSGDMSIGSGNKISMSDYMMQKCHSLSELNPNRIRPNSPDGPYLSDTRKSVSDGILSDESTCNWSRVMRGSLCKGSLGADLNASTASSVLSVSDIIKVFREQPSSATPRSIIDALWAGAGAKNEKPLQEDCLGQSYISSQSGRTSNHSPPERDVQPSSLTRSSSNSSLQTDELCSPPGAAKASPKFASMDRIVIDRTSLSSFKSLPVSNHAMQSDMSRLSMDARFLNAHSTPSNSKFVANLKKPVVHGSKSNFSKNDSQLWSSYGTSIKNPHTSAVSSIKGSDFELVLSDPSADSKFEAACGISQVEFNRRESNVSKTNNGTISAVNNSDNECNDNLLTPSSSASSNSKRHYDSDNSKTIVNRSKTESTRSSSKIDTNQSRSSKTSHTLTHKNQNEGTMDKKFKNIDSAGSSSNSSSGHQNPIIYQSMDSVDMKLSNQEYPSFENSEELEFRNFNSDESSEPCRFWLSDTENLFRDEHDHSLSTINYTIDALSDCNDNELSQLSSVSSYLLTEVQSNSSILCELDKEKSKIKLNFDDGGSANADDPINAGIHCIGTPVDVIVPVLNKSKYDIVWQISYELTSIDCNQSNLNLAHIIVPKKTFSVPSNRKSNVHLIIIPVVATAITVSLKIESLYKSKSGISSSEKSSISQIIRIVGEDPQLSIVSNSSVIYFGKLPNGCVKNENIILQNTGHSRLPLKFSVEDSGKAEVYQGHTILEPNEKWSGVINVFAKKLPRETTNNNGAANICGLLNIKLNVDPKVIKGSKSLCIIEMKAHVFLVELLCASHSSPLILSKPDSSHICSDVLDIKNNSKIPLNVSASINAENESIKSCFDIRPSTILMVPDQIVRFVVSFNSKKCTLRKVDAVVYLQVEPRGIIFKSPIEVLIAPVLMSKAESLEKLNLSDPKNCTSNPASCPSSPTSSIASAVGQMQLACDVACLMWSSVALHHSEIQSCLVKNCGPHREKLLFQLSDNKNCFKIVKSERDASYVSELKMSLNPSECKKLSVALFPSVPQTQAFGRITITRFGQDPNSSIDSNGMPVKRVLPLYGFNGRSNIKLNGLSKDVDDRLWLHPDSETFESTFTLENSGDAAAFVKIVTEQYSDDYVKPNEYILAPNESTNINFAVNLSACRIEKLLEKQKNKDVLQVSQLLLYYGDESTRKRIKRIVTKCKKKGVKLPDVNDKLFYVTNISSKCDISVDQLYDPVENVSCLLDEIKVVQIGILMERTALESALLDTSHVFNDLNTTVREVSIMSPASSITVEPQSLSLPGVGRSKFLNVTNLSSREASFHAVFPPELSVNPSQASLKAHQDVQLSVTHVGPKLQNSRFEQKFIRIISDKCETKVAVEIRHEEECREFVPSSIYSNDYNIIFPTTVINHKSITTIKVHNTSQLDVMLMLADCDEPFYIPSENFLLKKKWYCNFRIFFQPQTAGTHRGQAKFCVLSGDKQISTLSYDLTAVAVSQKMKKTSQIL